MTDTQFCFAVSVPVLFNTLFFAALLLYSSRKPNPIAPHQRQDDSRELWRAELRRVEDILGVRIKHLEDKR